MPVSGVGSGSLYYTFLPFILSTRNFAIMAITKVMICTIGTASHTPVSFSIGGRIRSIRSVPTGSAYTRR